jgi:hypothetical protein
MIEAAVAPLREQLATAVKYGESVALQAWGFEHDPEAGGPHDDGLFLCAEDGGPDTSGKPFRLLGMARADIWESWKVSRGIPHTPATRMTRQATTKSTTSTKTKVRTKVRTKIKPARPQTKKRTGW